MGKDWRDNKFGRESDYSALNESEDWKFTSVSFAVFALFAVCVIGLAVWLLGLL